VHPIDPRRAGPLLAALAAIKFSLQALALTPYGWFRDELYYVACSERLAFGYVDHPPLSVFVLWLWRALFGNSLAAMRLAPAITGAAVVWLAGALALELGGGLLAALLAGAAALSAPLLVGVDHLYSMNALDGLFWALGAWLVVRAVSAPSPGRWAALGVVLGLGLLNKWSVLWLGAGLAVGLVITPARRALATPGPWLAAAIAAALFAPNLAWQARHGWPTLEFMHNAMADKYVRTSLGGFLAQQVALMGPGAVPLALAGIAGPLFDRRAVAPRVLAAAFVVTLLIVAGSGSGKAEYLGPGYPLVFATGAVAAERWIPARARSFAAPAAAVAMIAIGAIGWPFVLPMLSEDRFIAYASRLGVKPSTSEQKELGALPQHYADMHGWDELVAAAAEAYATLAPEEREGAVVMAVTGGYGPAAAIDVLGRRAGLPRAISGHNNYWLWGFGDREPTAMILLGGRLDQLELEFASLVRVTTVECGLCMPYENHKPVWVGRGLKRPLSAVWPEVKHYD
jgi:hypothetical protein